MDSILLILEFFGGLVLLFALATWIGHIFHLDKYL
jgi:hypothetical protein